jgi:hypothetical protein
LCTLPLKGYGINNRSRDDRTASLSSRNCKTVNYLSAASRKLHKGTAYFSQVLEKHPEERKGKR